MPATQLRQPPGNYLCGLTIWHPQWMQRYATTRTFMAVYGLLGTIQAMSYMYFVVTLTTIEKRFKIPSQTTGIILSGNEISQILLSLILSYIGGQRNRPRWIAWGIVFCGLSCFILALPHFIYGAGEDVLHLTQEYADDIAEREANLTSFRSGISLIDTSTHTQQLCRTIKLESECDKLLTIVPLILIFLSQFVLGVGNTLYYSLGQTYLDDNTKKTNTPLMLAVAMALRMIGPIFGFFLGFISLNMFIDPSKTPTIDSKDPRWLGAWWFGWTILGTLMVLFSGLIGLFPKQLPKKKTYEKYNSHIPQVLRHEELQMDDGLPLGRSFASNATLDTLPTSPAIAELKDFPKALMRLLRNKLLIYNIIGAVFYILGATGYMTFLSRYMEVQFHKSAHEATIIVGPISIIGMIIGLLGSGIIISKKRPSPSKVLMWNVVVGGVYIIGQMSYMFMYCGDSMSLRNHENNNFTTACNVNCSCDGVPYSPVCHEATDTTYFSPCHAGCHAWDSDAKLFSNCSCLASNMDNLLTSTTQLPSIESSTIADTISSSTILPKVIKNFISSTLTTTTTSRSFTTNSIHSTEHAEYDLGETTLEIFVDSTTEAVPIRNRRSVFETMNDALKPGVCLKGCQFAFWSFSITSMIVNWFGSSGRIGNLLVNYRAVSTQDKSFAQGLALMMVSLLALIPGPIIFGRIIDSTCLVWTQTCNGTGNCQLYDQTRFRYLVNGMACILTAIGLIFDLLVWYYGRHLDLYGEKEAKRLEEARRKNHAITPLLAKQ